MNVVIIVAAIVGVIVLLFLLGREYPAFALWVGMALVIALAAWGVSNYWQIVDLSNPLWWVVLILLAPSTLGFLFTFVIITVRAGQLILGSRR